MDKRENVSLLAGPESEELAKLLPIFCLQKRREKKLIFFLGYLISQTYAMIGTDLPVRSELEGVCPINSFPPRRPHKCKGPLFRGGLEAIPLELWLSWPVSGLGCRGKNTQERKIRGRCAVTP